ncbi:CoA-acylating methylmalonate-semialdehyde dehydrogenase [Nocardioides ferulae]|uniref:CoA-acylating methylmalonate-semialdehyde dehydrogenase n=1 Tax=Nocardioides ferulae TaxID=2340821 RepID=UPI000EB0DBCA|nr:CoA-acylating methylmalonate-semialdehyde dehydrogenase [Nocardioides ferulae]
MNPAATIADEPDRIGHWRGGQPWSGGSDRWGDVHDPATGRVTGRVELATREQVDAVVADAAAAGREWAAASLSRRTSVLFAFREAVHRRRDELAAAITAEHGKVLDDALGEVQRGLEVVEFACGAPHLLKGGYSDGVSTGVDVYSIRQPLGVVAVISPFNFPVMVPLWFVPVAIACGNAVVLKPSEKDPSASLLMAQLWAEAGLPPGVFNVVQGDKVAVDALLASPGVKAVSFVGSTPVARYVYETGTRHGKRVQALGGAKNHMVVLPDADLQGAADAAVSAGFGSAGERCMAVSVVVAVDPVADSLVPLIAERIAGLRTGDGRRGCDMGPLVTGAHRDRVAGLVQAGVAAGAELVVDGRDVAPDGEAGGFWLGPTLFDRVEPGTPVYDEEIFGPVLSVVRVASYDDALALVNANPYGNGTAIFTHDGGAARRFQREVEVGMVGINVPIPVPMAYYSFGGWKASLFGDTHAHGLDGVHFYTRGKVVTSRWPDPAAPRPGIDLGFPQHT